MTHDITGLQRILILMGKWRRAAVICNFIRILLLHFPAGLLLLGLLLLRDGVPHGPGSQRDCSEHRDELLHLFESSTAELD